MKYNDKTLEQNTLLGCASDLLRFLAMCKNMAHYWAGHVVY